MMAALSAAGAGSRVTLLEPNEKVGRKLYITGKGRCNLTNCCEVTEVLANVPRNPRFLTSALTKFPPKAVMAYFEGLGVPLKVERGNRVFPVSDKAADVVDALFFALKKRGVALVHDRAVELLTKDGAVVGVRGEKKDYLGDAVILATGGLSYPLTGSTGDGYRLAQSAGHTVIPPKPSLIPLEAEDCAPMQGLTLKNVALTVKSDGIKPVFHDQGELLFTHFGLSGPLMLSASAHMRAFEKESYTAIIDLKPALDEQTLDARLLRELSGNPNRAFHNVLESLVPRAMTALLARRCGVDPQKSANAVTKGERRRLLETLKGLAFPIAGPRPIEEAVVTAGGVKTSEIDPKTMESKLCKGLYLAGEMIDVDAYTGGFNLQIAWCTGCVAGGSAGTDQPKEG